MLADAAAVGHHGDAVCAQLVSGADAAAHEQRRRMDGAGANNHLARPDLALSVRPAHTDASATDAVEYQVLHTARAHHRQIGPAPHFGGQVAPGRAHAHGVGVAVGDRKEAVIEARVLIGDVGPALVFDRRHHAARETRPALGRIALQADWPILAVQWTVEVAVGFELLEEGQYAFPVPASGAGRSPGVIVRRQAPIGRHAIDR